MLNKQLSSLSKHLREQARKNEELENLVTDLQRQMANFRYGGHAMEQGAPDDSLRQFGSRHLLFGGAAHFDDISKKPRKTLLGQWWFERAFTLKGLVDTRKLNSSVQADVSSETNSVTRGGG